MIAMRSLMARYLRCYPLVLAAWAVSLSSHAALPVLPITQGEVSDTYNPGGGIGRLNLAANRDGANAANVRMFLPLQWTRPCTTGFDVVFLLHGTSQNAQDAIDWIPNSMRQEGIIFIALKNS